MQKIQTNDGSYTFYSEQYTESYHSRSGALEESFKKYVEPCKIKEFAKIGKIQILDICFGLGYNSIAAISAALEENQACEILITALEKDSSIFAAIQEITLPKNLEFYYMQLKEQLLANRHKISIENHNGEKTVEIEIILGDAIETIKKINSHFDAVFLDPFSPKKNPELWAVSFFNDIKRVAKKKAVVATYSCARLVRENLKSAGFAVIDGPIVGRKAPATIAFLE